MYPNPSSNILNFQSNEVIDKVLVYNKLGQILFDKSVQNELFSLDISELQSGQYFVNLVAGEAITTKIFIKN